LRCGCSWGKSSSLLQLTAVMLRQQRQQPQRQPGSNRHPAADCGQQQGPPPPSRGVLVSCGAEVTAAAACRSAQQCCWQQQKPGSNRHPAADREQLQRSHHTFKRSVHFRCSRGNSSSSLAAASPLQPTVDSCQWHHNIRCVCVQLVQLMQQPAAATAAAAAAVGMLRAACSLVNQQG
jgi:hypothetical protein